MKERREIFDQTELEWENITEFNSRIVPKDFNIVVICDFLTKILVKMEDELVESGSDRPSVKGRNMYHSVMVNKAEVSVTEELLFFRAEIGASMMNEMRLTFVAIDKENGKIFLSRCNCKQNVGGQCTHVAILLYLIEDFQLNGPENLKIYESCTSKSQSWGQGKKRKKHQG